MPTEDSLPPFGYEEAAIVRAMIQHENELRNNRIVWFITIEGLLFAALGFAWKDAHQLVYILCLLGLATAISSSRELKLSSLGVNHLKNWWRAWLHQHEHHTYTGPPVIGLDLENLSTNPWGLKLRPARMLPWLFVGAWILVILIHRFVPAEKEVQDVRMVASVATPPLPSKNQLYVF